MVKIYVDLIRARQMTLEQVPEKWRDEVRQALEGWYAVRTYRRSGRRCNNRPDPHIARHKRHVRRVFCFARRGRIRCAFSGRGRGWIPRHHKGQRRQSAEANTHEEPKGRADRLQGRRGRDNAVVGMPPAQGRVVPWATQDPMANHGGNGRQRAVRPACRDRKTARPDAGRIQRAKSREFAPCGRVRQDRPRIRRERKRAYKGTCKR